MITHLILFYCSAVWFGTFKQNIHKLQLLQNFAARILTETKKYDHITAVLKTLGWPTIGEQLWLRDVTMMSELANKAEIAILTARDTTRAWVSGRGIMGRNVGVYKKGYNTWLSSRPQNQPRSFRFVLFNFFSLFSSFFFRYHASSTVGSAALISFL